MIGMKKGITRISFRTQDNKKISFLKEDAVWKWAQGQKKKSDQKLDQDIIKKYVNTLYFLRVDEVVESEKSPNLIEKYKLNKPEWRWDVDHVKGGKWSLSMSKQEKGKGESFYLLSSSSRGIYRLDRDVIEELHKNEEDFFEKESSSDETSSEESSSQEDS